MPASFTIEQIPLGIISNIPGGINPELDGAKKLLSFDGIRNKLKQREKDTPMETMYIDEIKNILPHRYPFLMVDRVVDITPGEEGTGIKNVTANEEFFNGHFPTSPVMPGVLMLEAIAQTAVLVGALSRKPEERGQIILLTGIDEAKFKNRVIPGDVLHIHVKKLAKKGPFEKWEAEVTVDGKLCVSAVMSAMNSGTTKL
jgi:3-hydroxyacyl-[acyl-carrier-protein] dehydratase